MVPAAPQGNPPAMLSVLIKPAIAVLLSAAAFAGVASEAQAPPNQPLIFEGPGGRSALTRWTLRKDPANRGLALGYASGHFSGSAVTVPNVVDPSPYAGRAGAANYEGSIAWYRTSFQAPQTGVYALTFQSANYKATVWVDGHELGSHHGSYLPFEFHASLAAGTHTVVVRVDWEHPTQQEHEGFHRTWFNWGGLDGQVEVRMLGMSELSQPTLQTTLAPDSAEATQAQVKVSVQVRNYGPARTITPQGTISDGAQKIQLSFPALALAQGESATDSTTATVAEPALWSPLHANLYELSLEVPGESSYAARVGLRELTWHGGNAYLNGQLLRLHGVSIQEDAEGHGDALTPADEATIMQELKEVDANVVRSQHPLDPALLERLDAAGILVWQGIGPVEGAGNWYSTTAKLRSEAEAQARTTVIAAQLHPSIFAWNLADEIAGEGRDAAEVEYVENLTSWIHAHDPTRMVAVDVWGDHPPRIAGPIYANVDAVAETDYEGWYDNPHDSPAQLAAKMRARLAAMQKTFAGKVLVISEFGAESNGLNPSGTPGSYGYQARVLEEHIKVYDADPKLTAMMIWLLRDYPLEPTFEGGSIREVLPHVKLAQGIDAKGLFTYSGQAKPAVSTVARLYQALPAL
jgi:hypothetical protein